MWHEGAHNDISASAPSDISLSIPIVCVSVGWVGGLGEVEMSKEHRKLPWCIFSRNRAFFLMCVCFVSIIQDTRTRISPFWLRAEKGWSSGRRRALNELMHVRLSRRALTFGRFVRCTKKINFRPWKYLFFHISLSSSEINFAQPSKLCCSLVERGTTYFNRSAQKTKRDAKPAYFNAYSRP